MNDHHYDFTQVINLLRLVLSEEIDDHSTRENILRDLEHLNSLMEAYGEDLYADGWTDGYEQGGR